MTNNVIPTPPKPKQPNAANGNTISNISQGLGYLIMWTGSTTQAYTDMQKFAVDAQLPSSITKDITQHTVAASLGLAKNDARWRKVLHNGYRVEVKQLSYDDKSGVHVMEFLGYSIDDDGKSKKGKREHFDKVALDSNGAWIAKGSTEAAAEFIKLVDDHRSNLRGQDVYEKVTGPVLKMLKRVRIARNCYFVTNSKENNDLIDKLDDFFSKIGYSLICLTQKNDNRTKKGLTSQIKAELDSRMAEITSKVQDWKSKNRVHGRSSKKVFEELAEILEETKGIEKALSCSLQSLQDEILQVQTEANVIINSQAPTGVNDVVYNDFKTLLGNTKNVIEDTTHGAVLMCKASDLAQYVKGDKLNKSAVNVLKSLGYYHFMADGIIILRPIAELAA